VVCSGFGRGVCFSWLRERIVFSEFLLNSKPALYYVSKYFVSTGLILGVKEMFHFARPFLVFERIERR